MVEGLPSRRLLALRAEEPLPDPAKPRVRCAVDDRGLVQFSAIPCRVPSLAHKTLAQVKTALLAADCHLGKVHQHLVTKRRHVLRVIKQVPRARTKHVAYYTVGITLG